MSIFLSFSVLGLAIFFITVTSVPRQISPRYPAVPTPPPTGPSFLRVCHAVIRRFLPKDPLLRWVMVVLLISIPVIAFFAWMNWEALRSGNQPTESFIEFIGSKFFGTALFGICFGVLLGYWLSSVFHRSEKTPPSYQEIITSVLMIILLTIGIVGQDTIIQLFARLNNFEVPGAKFGFVPTDKNQNTTSKASANAQIEKLPPNRSSGLATASNISRQLDLDRSYLSIMMNSHKLMLASLDRDLILHKEAYISKIGNFARCLSDLVTDNQDDRTVIQATELMLDYMQRYLDNEIPDFSKAGSELGTPEYRRYGKNCFRGLSTSKATENLNSKGFPYINIIYANLAAYTGNPVLAINVLNRWLAEYGYPDNANKAEAIKALVFRTRVRTQLSIIIEEWRVTRPSLALYNTAVLSDLIKDFESDELKTLVGDPYEQIKNGPPRGSSMDFSGHYYDSEPCRAAFVAHEPESWFHELSRIFDGDIEPSWIYKLLEVRALITLKLTWIEATLHDTHFRQRLADQANNYVEELTSASLSCFQKLGRYDNKVAGRPKDETAVRRRIDLLRVEILIAYARVKIASYLDGGKTELLSDAAVHTRLENAKGAVVLAKAILKDLSFESSAAEASPCSCETGARLSDALSVAPEEQYQSELDELSRRLSM